MGQYWEHSYPIDSLATLKAEASPPPIAVIKRTGQRVPFDQNKITSAIRRCLIATGVNPNFAEAISDSVMSSIYRNGRSNQLNVEEIQDIVEVTLIACGQIEAARNYIRYRDEHARLRQDEPIPQLIKDRFESNKKYFPTPLQEFQFYDKYSRYDHALGGREVWSDTVERAVLFLVELSGGLLRPADVERISQAMLWMKAMPSMRLIATAGEAARRQNLSIYNCSYLPVSDLDAFKEALLISMAGCGVGYSVERNYVENLPRIRRQKQVKPRPYIIEDTTEGWAEALIVGLQTWFDGFEVEFDFSLIRPAGAVLKTKGGRASGPEPLRALLDFARGKILSKQGLYLSTLDAHDLMCMVGQAAVSGGHRRTAMISVFDRDDQAMATCKHGDLSKNTQRWNANNSEVWTGPLTQADLMRFILTMDDSARGEPGIFSRLAANTTRPDRRRAAEFGCNPCQPGFATVSTPDGIRTFDQIEVGSTIWSGSSWTKVMNKWQTGVKPVYRYRTSSGEFIGTENHRVIYHGERVEVGQAEAIDVAAGGLTTSATDLDPVDVMAGLLVGDGSVHKASNNLIYLIVGENDSDYFLDKGLISLFLRERPGLKPGAWEVEHSLHYLWLPKTHKRFTPPPYNGANARRIAGFLRGLFSANGSVVSNRVTLKQSSWRLICEVQEMLSTLGIRSYVTTNKPSWSNHKNGRYKSKQSYDLNITTDRFIFARSIGFLQSYKNDKIVGEVIQGQKSASIQSIEFLGVYPVYDITVDDPEHTYWTGGLLVSNCGEINLRPYELCNLSIAVARADDTYESLLEKVGLATLIGTIQSMATHFPGLRPDWSKNCEEERLLGVDITGQLDCPILQDEEILRGLRLHAVETNRRYAAEFGINQSASVTCVKPSGNSSRLLDCSPGLHGRWSKYYINNVRISATSPVFKTMRAAGVPMKPETGQNEENATTWVASFPVKAPDGAILSGDRTALDQLEAWKRVKINWTEHNPSVTITYRPEELFEITKWLYENQEIVGGLTFFPYSDAKFDQPPYISITQAQYDQLVADFPVIDWSELYRYEQSDQTEAAQLVACVSGQCDI